MGNFKKFLFTFCLLSLGFLQAQESVKDLLSIPGPIQLNGNELFLNWSKQNSKTLSVQQYLPRDENIQNFTELLSFSYFNKEIDIEMAVRQKVESIQRQMQKDKFAKVDVTESPDGKEYIVDYTISEGSEKGEPFVEYNIYRFKSYENAGNKSFLILSYAKRIYGEDYKGASKSFARERDALMTALIEYKIPEIKLINQEPVPVKK